METRPRMAGFRDENSSDCVPCVATRARSQPVRQGPRHRHRRTARRSRSRRSRWARAGRTRSATNASAATANPAPTRHTVRTPCANTSAGIPAPAWLVAESKMVTSTARPTAAPSCWLTLTRPDAAPASRGATSASDADVRLTNDTPAPAPMSTSAVTISPYDADACSCVATQQADHRRADPEEHDGLLRKATNEDPAGQLRRQEHRCGHGQEREPGTQRRVALHVLQELAHEEEHPVHAGVDESACGIRRRSGSVGQQPQRQHRFLRPALGGDERREQRSRRRSTSRSSARSSNPPTRTRRDRTR